MPWKLWLTGNRKSLNRTDLEHKILHNFQYIQESCIILHYNGLRIGDLCFVFALIIACKERWWIMRWLQALIFWLNEGIVFIDGHSTPVRKVINIRNYVLRQTTSHRQWNSSFKTCLGTCKIHSKFSVSFSKRLILQLRNFQKGVRRISRISNNEKSANFLFIYLKTKSILGYLLYSLFHIYF